MENSEQGKYDKIKKTIFYGEGLPSKDEGKLDYSLTHAFNYLKEETVFDADIAEALLWKRVEEYALLAVEAHKAEYPCEVNYAGFCGRFKTQEDATAFISRCLFYGNKYTGNEERLFETLKKVGSVLNLLDSNGLTANEQADAIENLSHSIAYALDQYTKTKIEQ